MTRLFWVLRNLGGALTLVVYGAMAPIGYAAFMLLALVPSRDPVGRARLLQGIMRRAFGFMHDYLRVFHLFHYDRRAMVGRLPAAPCVIVANHPTLADVTVIMGTVGGVCTMVKPELYRLWWLRPLLIGSAQFEGANNPLGSQAVVDAAVKRLEQGFRVLIFPESTRSPVGGLHDFGRTAFEVACRARVEVVPLVIRIAPPWLSRGDRFLNPPLELPRLTVEALPSIEPSDHAYDSRRLRNATEKAYCRLLVTEGK